MPAFQWLTGWTPEDLIDSLGGVDVAGGQLFERLAAAAAANAKTPDARRALAVASLVSHAAPARAPPRLLVFCGPSGARARLARQRSDRVPA